MKRFLTCLCLVVMSLALFSGLAGDAEKVRINLLSTPFGTGSYVLGTALENIRHFIELRGIGIVNVARVFGVGAVKVSESLDLVVQLEAWDPTKNYQRTGLESEYYEILGVNIPSTIIPVSPGRNLAVVLETAAINNRQKKMGYNAAKELLIRLGLNDTMD